MEKTKRSHDSSLQIDGLVAVAERKRPSPVLPGSLERSNGVTLAQRET